MDHARPWREDVLTRRRLLATAAAGLGTGAIASSVAWTGVTEAAAPTSRAPWTDYFGAVQDTPPWSSVQRGGQFADADGKVRRHDLRDHLDICDLLSWSAPHPSQRTPDGVREFMNLVRTTDGRWWRDQLERYTDGLIDVHKTTPHKVLGIQLGNEISADDYRRAIEGWARGAGQPYPHPRTNYGDTGWYRRDHLGYYAEYFLAPAVQGIWAANGKARPEDRIPIVLGSVVGVRDGFVRDRFLPALLNYRIAGTFAPTLRGRRVKDVVHYVAIHYLLTAEKIFGYADAHGVPLPYGHRSALADMHRRWVGNGRIRGIWHTEEGGTVAQQDDRHASLAVRVFGRTMSWAIDESIPPSQLRMFGMYKPPAEGWGGYEPRRLTSWSFAMNVLHRFLGHSTRLKNRSAGIGSDATDPIEKYAFETTTGRRRRVVIVTPQTAAWQGPTNVRTVRMRAAGWDAPVSRVRAIGHLFTSDGAGYRRLEIGVRRSRDHTMYHLDLPWRVALNRDGDMRTLLIQVERT